MNAGHVFVGLQSLLTSALWLTEVRPPFREFSLARLMYEDRKRPRLASCLRPLDEKMNGGFEEGEGFTVRAIQFREAREIKSLKVPTRMALIPAALVYVPCLWLLQPRNSKYPNLEALGPEYPRGSKYPIVQVSGPKYGTRDLKYLYLDPLGSIPAPDHPSKVYTRPSFS